jgi:hypothetical protein
MKTKQYKQTDPRWANVAGKVGVSDVPNAFTQVLYNYRNQTAIDKITHAIELGTFEGDTAQIFAEHFDRVSTVEQFIQGNSYTSINLFEKYKSLKQQYSNIDFYNACSTKFLEEFLSKNPHEQFVMLIDAHTPTYSPVIDEFKAIQQFSKRNDHIIIVDDCIDIGSPGWPSHEEFQAAFAAINPKYVCEYTGIGRDILIIYEPS